MSAADAWVFGVTTLVIASHCFGSQAYDPQAIRIGPRVAEICNFESSQREGRFVVNPFVDDDLDERKRRYLELPELMTDIARGEIKLYPVSSCAIVYYPQLGYRKKASAPHRVQLVPVFLRALC